MKHLLLLLLLLSALLLEPLAAQHAAETTYPATGAFKLVDGLRFYSEITSNET